MKEADAKKFVRKPIGNFFIKRDLQIRLITKIVFSAVLATLIFAATLLATYHVTYGGLVYYPVDLNEGIGDRTPIVDLIMLPLVISAVLNVLVACGVGLYASRKYAVPIFKLEQWASLLKDGNMTARLRFREKEEMKELCTSCNAVSDILRQKFIDIKDEVNRLSAGPGTGSDLGKLQHILDGLSLEAAPIEVHTTYMRRDSLLDVKDGPGNSGQA